MAKLSEIAHIYIDGTEVSSGGEFREEILNSLLRKKGFDPETGLPLARVDWDTPEINPETGLYVTSVAEVGEEMLERADEIIIAVSRALLPSFREVHPSIRYLVGKALLEEDTERAIKLIAAYLNLTGNGSMPEYGVVAVYDERYDSREKAQNQDEAQALREWRSIKKAEELHRFETNFDREDGLEAEYPEEEYLSPRKERLEKRLTTRTIAGFEKLVKDDGKEIAQWLASLSDEELDFFIGDSAPYLKKELSKAQKRYAGRVVYADPKDPKSPVVSGLFRKIVETTGFRIGYQRVPKAEAAAELSKTWVIPQELFEEALSAPEVLQKQDQGWGLSLWESSMVFARCYDISGREAELTGRDKGIASIAVTHGKYTRAEPALNWGGFLSKDEAKQYLDSLNLKPEKLEAAKARVFGAMKVIYQERQDYIQHGVVLVAQRFAREVWRCINPRKSLSNIEKLVAAIGLLHSPYLASRRTLGLNWGGFDSLDEARHYLEKFPVPLPRDTLPYLTKRVTYAIYEQAPKMPKEAA